MRAPPRRYTVSSVLRGWFSSSIGRRIQSSGLNDRTRHAGGEERAQPPARGAAGAAQDVPLGLTAGIIGPGSQDEADPTRSRAGRNPGIPADDPRRRARCSQPTSSSWLLQDAERQDPSRGARHRALTSRSPRRKLSRACREARPLLPSDIVPELRGARHRAKGRSQAGRVRRR